MSESRIRKLDELVINRIAAGEVIQRPANAIKELLENSIDAGSTSIQVVLKNGGLKYLQIHDNGHGIRKDDMPIVAERFTTSKLRTFEDLTSIATYGFRGEALASISHVAHLSILSRVAESQCAYKGQYTDGKLVGKLMPCAGVTGTQITAEDLFHNMSTRKLALNSQSEEFRRVFEVITRYALHNSHVAFSLKKFAEVQSEVRTLGSHKPTELVKMLFGVQAGKDLIEVNCEFKDYKVKYSGLLSGMGVQLKKTIFVLFVNNRLVENAALKRQLEAIYALYLPRNTYPFIYVSLHIAPQNVDVNVHPTKQEVHFLHEDDIIAAVQREADRLLVVASNSKTFYAQTLLPHLPNPVVAATAARTPARSSVGEVAPQHTIREDGKLQKLDQFFRPLQSTKISADNSVQDISFSELQEGDISAGNTVKQSSLADLAPELDDTTRWPITKQSPRSAPSSALGNTPPGRSLLPSSSTIVPPSRPALPTHSAAPPTRSLLLPSHSVAAKKRSHSDISTKPVIRLTSVLRLRDEIKSRSHVALRGIMSTHYFVGCVSDAYSLLQHNTSLYLVDNLKLTKHFFYQLMLEQFGVCGQLHLSEPAPIAELALLALRSPASGWTPEDGDRGEIAGFVRRHMMDKRAMLLDYFAIELSDSGDLISLPLLLEKYDPDFTHLPMFILRLVVEVDWTTEKPCFHGICEEIATLFAIQAKIFSDGLSAVDDDRRWVTEHVVYRAMKECFLPPTACADDGSLLQLTSLPELYKVFERC